jgi:hypothetical protein
MASTKTIIKKATRRRGTVSLTKVREAVDSVYARYASARSNNGKVKTRTIKKAKKPRVTVLASH